MPDNSDPAEYFFDDGAYGSDSAEGPEPTDPTVGQAADPRVGYRGAACWPPVVPSAAVPVEVSEDDCWCGDDPNTIGTAAAQNRVWCVQCADWTDQAIAHDTEHRRIAEGDLVGFAARVRAEEEAAERAQIAKAGVVTDWDAEGNAVSVTFSMAALREHNARAGAAVRAEERERIAAEIRTYAGPPEYPACWAHDIRAALVKD